MNIVKQRSARANVEVEYKKVLQGIGTLFSGNAKNIARKRDKKKLRKQVVFLNDGYSIRNRYDTPFSLFIWTYNNYNSPDWLCKIITSWGIEKYLGNDKMNWHFGFGTGFLIIIWRKYFCSGRFTVDSF